MNLLAFTACCVDYYPLKTGAEVASEVAQIWGGEAGLYELM